MPQTKITEDQAEDSEFLFESEFPHALTDTHAHTDVLGTPAVGQGLVWNGTKFIPQTVGAAEFGELIFDRAGGLVYALRARHVPVTLT